MDLSHPSKAIAYGVNETLRDVESRPNVGGWLDFQFASTDFVSVGGFGGATGIACFGVIRVFSRGACLLLTVSEDDGVVIPNA